MKIKNLEMYEGMLIIVDMVNGFVKKGDLADSKIGEVVPRQIELIKEAKEKGDLIAIEGRLANQYWQDNQGNNHYKNIVICESIEYLAKKNNNAQSDTQFNSNQEALSRAMNEESFVDFGNQIELDDDLELPFWGYHERAIWKNIFKKITRLHY